MKKAEFEVKVQEALGTVEYEVTKKDTALICYTVFQTILDLIAEGEEVPMGVLGKMTTTERAARTARNIQTGEPIEVPAKTVPKYKPSKLTKETVDNK